MNYIQRIYDLLTEAVEISESKRASREETRRLKKKYKLDKRGETSYSPETGEKTYAGRAGKLGTGEGGKPQQVAPMADIGDLTREVRPGAHTGSNRYTIGGDSRGVKKERLTSTPRKEAEKLQKPPTKRKKPQRLPHNVGKPKRRGSRRGRRSIGY